MNTNGFKYSPDSPFIEHRHNYSIKKDFLNAVTSPVAVTAKRLSKEILSKILGNIKLYFVDKGTEPLTKSTTKLTMAKIATCRTSWNERSLLHEGVAKLITKDPNVSYTGDRSTKEMRSIDREVLSMAPLLVYRVLKELERGEEIFSYNPLHRYSELGFLRF
jgi:hypothetical protein